MRWKQAFLLVEDELVSPALEAVGEEILSLAHHLLEAVAIGRGGGRRPKSRIEKWEEDE